MQLLWLLLALLPALGERYWSKVKSLSLHLSPGECRDGADVVSTTSAGPSSLLSGSGCLHHGHEREVGYGFSPRARLFGVGWLGDVTPWKCERGVGGRWAQRAEEVDGALRRGGGLHVPLGCGVVPLLVPSLRSCLLQIQKV